MSDPRCIELVVGMVSVCSLTGCSMVHCPVVCLSVHIGLLAILIISMSDHTDDAAVTKTTTMENSPTITTSILTAPILARPNLAGSDFAAPTLAGPDFAAPTLAGPDFAAPTLAGPDFAELLL